MHADPDLITKSIEQLMAICSRENDRIFVSVYMKRLLTAMSNKRHRISTSLSPGS